MEGAIDTSDVILNRGLNGGYGYGQNGNFGNDGSVTNANVNANRDINSMGFGTAARDHESLRDQLRDQDTRNQLNALQVQIAASAAAAAECCCENRVANARLEGKIDGVEQHLLLATANALTESLRAEIATLRSAPSTGGPGNSGGGNGGGRLDYADVQAIAREVAVMTSAVATAVAV